MPDTVICWCRDDADVTEAFKDYIKENPGVYTYRGCRIAALNSVIERVNGDDRLIITAHGNEEEFGEADAESPGLTVEVFLGKIMEVKKDPDWVGKIYFDTCFGYDYAKSLKELTREKFRNLQLFGAEGETGVKIDISKHREAK